MTQFVLEDAQIVYEHPSLFRYLNANETRTVLEFFADKIDGKSLAYKREVSNGLNLQCIRAIGSAQFDSKKPLVIGWLDIPVLITRLLDESSRDDGAHTLDTLALIHQLIAASNPDGIHTSTKRSALSAILDVNDANEMDRVFHGKLSGEWDWFTLAKNSKSTMLLTNTISFGIASSDAAIVDSKAFDVLKLSNATAADAEKCFRIVLGFMLSRCLTVATLRNVLQILTEYLEWFHSVERGPEYDTVRALIAYWKSTAPLYWRYLSQTLPLDDILKCISDPLYAWDSAYLCRNPSLRLAHVRALCKHTLDWQEISTRIPSKEIESALHLPWDLCGLSRNPDVRISLVKRIMGMTPIAKKGFRGEFDWISLSQRSTEQEIWTNPSLPWCEAALSLNSNLSMSFVVCHPQFHWNWYVLSMRIPVQHVLKHRNCEWIHDGLVRNPTLTYADLRRPEFAGVMKAIKSKVVC